MIYEERYIRPLMLVKVPAFEKARAFYLQFARLKFEDDFLDYLKMGWVYSSPTSFAMACIINIADPKTTLIEPAWFIRTVIGDFAEVINMLWTQHKTEFVVWCRNDEDGGKKLRKYKMAALFRVAKGLKGNYGRSRGSKQRTTK